MSRARQRTVKGGCHCGAVRYRVSLGDPLTAHRCHCSICVVTGFVGIIVPEAAFELLAGGEALGEYRFNTGVARHWFCATCGVKSFYLPRSHPDGYNLNLNCLELDTDHAVVVEDFDGQNREANAGAIRHLSRPTLGQDVAKWRQCTNLWAGLNLPPLRRPMRRLTERTVSRAT